MNRMNTNFLNKYTKDLSHRSRIIIKRRVRLSAPTSYELAAALGRVTDLYSAEVHVTSTRRSNVSINVI